MPMRHDTQAYRESRARLFAHYLCLLGPDEWHTFAQLQLYMPRTHRREINEAAKYARTMPFEIDGVVHSLISSNRGYMLASTMPDVRASRSQAGAMSVSHVQRYIELGGDVRRVFHELPDTKLAEVALQIVSMLVERL